LDFIYTMFINLYLGLQTSLSSKTPKTSLGRFIKSNLSAHINRRFEGIEKQSLLPYFSRATLLDPRCKKAAFGVEQNASDAEKSIIMEVSSLTNKTLDAGNYLINILIVNNKYI